MQKKILIILAVFVLAVFSAQSSAAGPKPVKPPAATIQDLVGVWDVRIKEILIVGELDAKKAANPGTVEFLSDDPGDPANGVFNLANGAEAILPGFQAGFSLSKRGAKILWHITDDLAIEEGLVAAIRAWAAENNMNIVADPELDVRSYTFKPIVVVKKTASPKVGLFRVKGTVTMTIDDGEESPVQEVSDFKYQCIIKFASKEPIDSAAADADGDLEE